MKVDSWTDGKRTYTKNSTLCRNKVINYTRVQLNNRLHQSHSAVTIVARDNSSNESTKQQFAQWTVVSQSFRLTTWRLLKVVIGIAWFMVSNLYRYRSVYTPTFPLVGLLACTWSWWHGELAVSGGDSWSLKDRASGSRPWLLYHAEWHSLMSRHQRWVDILHVMVPAWNRHVRLWLGLP